MEAAGDLVSGGPDPGHRGPDEPQPSKEPEALGAKGPAAPEPGVVDKGEPDPTVRVRTIQKLVYYISEVFNEAKARYPETHMLI
jgi:hypothetical protein